MNYHKIASLQILFYALFLLAFVQSPSSLYAQGESALHDTRIKKSLVILELSPVSYNVIRPWIQESKQSSHALALVMPNKKLLALADDIEDAALIEVSQHSFYEKALAQVIHVDRAANLALLSVDKPGFFKKLKALPLGKDLAPGKSLHAARVDKLFHIYREKVNIREIHLISETGFTDLPVYSFHSQKRFPLGGLLLNRGKLYGLISYSGKEGEGEAILPSIIRAFFRNSTHASKRNSKKNSRDDFKSSFISQGFRLKSLVDPVKRAYYGLSYKNKGALVSRVLPGTSAWGSLEAKDILLSIDAIPIDPLGLYEDVRKRKKGWGRQNAQLLLTMKKGRIRKAGEIAELTILRKGKKKKLKMKLALYHGQGERIPSRIKGPANYFIENGIIFLELSLPLLENLYGKKWQQKAPHASYLFQTKRYYGSENSTTKKYKKEDEKSRERILVIGGVFPDPSTQGIDNFAGSILERVNGKRVLNLKSFRKNVLELARSGQGTVKLSLYGGRPLYLDLENRRQINARILKKYSIPAASSWELKRY